MRNLKRVLSLVMMIALLAGIMVIGAGAAYNDFTDKDKITHKTAVQTLVELNILAGKEDGSYYDPQGILTRAEAAKLVTVILNGGKAPVLGNPDYVSYNDTKDNWASAYIEFVTAKGIVAGDGQGNFLPNKTVTASELAKMLLVAIGYDAKFEGLVGNSWAAKTDVLANQNGLYEELDGLVTSDGLNRDDAAQMIYNVLTAHLVRYDSAGENGSVGTVADKINATVLSRYFNTDAVVGVVVANDIFAVEGSKAPTDKAKIAVRTINDVKDQGPEPETLPVDVDNDMVGQEVTVYVKNLGKTTQTVIGGVVPTEKNTVVTTTKALKNATKVNDFLKEIDLDVDAAALIWNGYASEASIKNDALQNTYGGMVRTIIDNNDDGDAEYVLVTEKTLSKITAYSTKDENLKIAGVSSAIDFEDTIAYTGMAKNDYVLYVDFNGTFYIEKATSVNGKISYVSTANDNVTIDGKVYAQSWLDYDVDDLNWAVPDKTMIGKTYDFYLDNDGNIIAWGDPAEAARDYALVIAAGTDNDILHNKSSAVKLLQADGTEKIYYVDLEATADKINEDFDVDIDKDDVAEFIEGLGYGIGDEFYGLIVAYTVNADGTVTLSMGDGTNWFVDEPDDDEYAIRTNSIYVVDGEGALASNSTIYFFYNEDTEEYSVINGINKLPLKDEETMVVQVAVAMDDGDAIAEAAFITGQVETEGDYAYVLEDYDINVDKDLVYTIITADAKTDTIVVKPVNAVDAEGLYKLVNVNDKTEARDDDKIFAGVAGQISADGSTLIVNGQAYTVASGVKVVDITDTDAPAAAAVTDISAGDYVDFVTDDDGFVTTIYVDTDYVASTSSPVL